jgi:hypothetical protein
MAPPLRITPCEGKLLFNRPLIWRSLLSGVEHPAIQNGVYIMMIRNLIIAIAVTAAPTTTAFAQATLMSLDRPNVAGNWKCEGRCQIPGGQAKLETPPNSATVICTNEVGQISVGVFATVQSIACWGLNGRLDQNFKAIDWGNGTQWTRQ